MAELTSNMPELKSYQIEMTFDIIGKRRTVLIIREILKGDTRFNYYLENIEVTQLLTGVYVN